MTRSARLHADGLTRCPWPGEDPFYMAYPDTEWGGPEYDDRAPYEKPPRDGFRAGRNRTGAGAERGRGGAGRLGGGGGEAGGGQEGRGG